MQLWINLPAKDKMADPKYRNLTSESIPVLEEPEAVVRVLSGYYKDQAGSIQGDYVQADYLDVQIKPGKTWKLRTEPENTVFIYIIEGGLQLASGTALPRREAVLFSEGEILSLSAGAEGARFVLLSARPLHEPVEWGGPIVMNTREELRQAFQDLEDGNFIRHRPSGTV